ncbi:MAG: ComEC/Rec2 family competence protein [Acidimicrobiia bacterium]|nr:ComEC/Rec2 family competence protein [Acidimicrobiia bacterium]
MGVERLRRRWGGPVMPYAAAAGAVTGAWLLVGVPLAVVLVLAAACLWRPSPLLALVAVAALAGFFGSRAVDGLADPPSRPVEGWVRLLDDPRPLGTNGVRVTVRHGDARLEARAYGAVAARLDDLLAGERVHVSGTARPAESDWHRWRHVAAIMNVDAVGDRAGAAPLAAFTNHVRRLLDSGARSLPDDSRAMFAGMVYGDDRSQSPRLYDDFRAAGLGHLLVVSGQNVAFVLALASPLVTRARPGVRLIVLLVLLAVFAVLTRFEPSVLRAVTMAGVAVISAALGRPETGRRTLAWAVAAVVVADPFLVRVLAFQLSVCATCGLLWITPALAEMLPGPRPLRLAAATTAGAQLAVMPLLVAVFGTVPVASLPANVAAGPASGITANWAPAVVAAASRSGRGAGRISASGGVGGVASGAAAAPRAMLGAGGGAMVGAGVALVLASRRLDGAGEPAAMGWMAAFVAVARRRLDGIRALAVLGGAVVAVAVTVSVLAAASPPPGWSDIGDARLFRHESVTVVVLDEPARPRDLLESLRLAGVRRVDLVVASHGGASDAHAVLALRDRYRSAAVVAPPMHRVPAARTVRAGDMVRVGVLAVEVVADAPDLAVAVSPAESS